MSDVPAPRFAEVTDGRAPAVLAAMCRQVEGLVDTLWSTHAAEELMDTVAAAEALRSTLDALLLGVLSELEASGEVRAHGWASTADFYTHTAGTHRRSGAGTLRLATATTDPVFGPVREALAAGALSLTKAQVVVRAVEALPGDPAVRARGVAVLLEESARLDATDLARAGRHLARVVDPDGEERRAERELDREERAAHLQRHLAITPDQAGGAWIRGRCSAEDAALISTTLLSLAAPVPAGACDPATCRIPGCPHDGRDPRDHGTRMLDALVEGCRRLQTARLLPTDHGATPRVTVTLPWADLAEGCGVALTDTGQELSAGVVRRLCCDAEVIPAVLGAAGEVLDLGRTQRLVTPALWRALVVRDAHCRFPGCTRPPLMCHAHHVVHWVDGGPTDLDNLILLCGHHHRLVHAGPWQLRPSTPGRFAFHPPPGVRAGTLPRPSRPRRE